MSIDITVKVFVDYLAKMLYNKAQKDFMRARRLVNMNDSDLNLLLYRVSSFYYNDNLSQNEIAKIEKVSRSQISRLLIMARERGIVEIKLSLPPMDTATIEAKLAEALSISNVMVSQTRQSDKNGRDNGVSRLATYASSLIPSLLEDCGTIGLGWGRTIYNISTQLPINRESRNKMFLPLVGNSGTHNPFLQTSSIVNWFSERFAASAFYANFSCIYHKGMLPDAYFDESIGQLNRYWDSLDAAVFSVGPKPEDDSFYISEVEAAGISREKAWYKCVSGEMLGHLYSTEGQIEWTELIPQEYQFVGISLNKLKNISKAICVATGAEKIDALIVAARNGFFNTLITDQITGQMILDRIDELEKK